MGLFHSALFLFLLAIQYSVAQIPNPKVMDVDGYPLSWLRDPQPGTPFALRDALPTPVPHRPLTMRIAYRVPQQLGDTTGVSTDPFIVRGAGFQSVNPSVTVRVRLMEPTSTSCIGTGWYAAPTPIAMTVTSEFSARVQLPWPTIAGFQEMPHEFLMPWICVCATALANPETECGVGAEGRWIFTNMRYSVVAPCDGDSLSFLSSAQIPTQDWNRLCAIRPNLSPRSEWGEVSPLIPQLTFANPTVFDVGLSTTTGIATTGSTVTNNTRLFLERRLRSVCCGWRAPGQLDPNNAGFSMMRRFGMCINPLLENCCVRTTTSLQGYHLNLLGALGGIGKPYSKFREKCCYGGTFDSTNEAATANPLLPPQPVIIAYLDDWCPCKTTQVATMCNQQVPMSGTATYGCCTNTKYPEILYSSSPSATTSSTAVSGTTQYINQIWGKCYDGTTYKCCNTGDLYDPGSKQCCQINGVQSVNIPCPCSIDGHCGNNQTCCQDITRLLFPTPASFDPLLLCNKYVNYPNGTGLYNVQPCIGQCIDSRYQICCNGMACIDEFELCCNSTCCNKYNQRCAIGVRPGSRGQPFNRNDFRAYYEVCTQTEAMTPFRATLAYFLPLCLLAATFISLFSLLNFAKRQSSLQPLSIYEYAVFVISFVGVLLAWPLFFSPVYKYGIVMIWVHFFVMLAALSQLRLVNIGAVVMLGLLLNYDIDPFYGNEILTLAFSRTPPPINSVLGFSGVTNSILMHVPGDYLHCTAFFDYFHRDANVEDQMRWDNPSKTTYGFCARGWLETLEVLTGLNIILTFINFFVMLATHLRNVLFEKATKTDDIVQQPWY